MDPTWTGNVMTSLGTCASIAAALFPKQRKILWGLLLVFAAAAFYSFHRAVTGDAKNVGPSARDILLSPWVLFAAVVALLGLLVSLYRSRRKLSIEPSLDGLDYAYPSNPAHTRIAAGQEGQVFAVLRVRNEWGDDFPDVVARCFMGRSGDEIPCFWSKDAGKNFVAGGEGAADLRVWQERALVIAQVFGRRKTWARLPKNPEILFRGFMSDPRSGAYYSVDPEEKSLNLDGTRVELTVSFKSAKLGNQTARFLCGFDAEGPTFTRQT